MGEFAISDRVGVDFLRSSSAPPPPLQIYEHVRKAKVEGGPPKAATPHKAGSFRQLNPW